MRIETRRLMRLSGGALALLLTCAPATHAQEAPMSAIDWLSQSVVAPVKQPPASEPGITPNAAPEQISVNVIGGPRLDSTGLVPASVSGLPRSLWGATPTEDLVTLLRAENLDTLPALQGLITTLLLTEADAPLDADNSGRLFLARIDRLLDLGALNQAAALLDQAGADNPELFRRAFDVALLLGHENEACTTLRDLPDVAPTFPTRIFCLARNGDWNAAALTLHTAEALGFVTEDERDLLARFLDPELFEGEPPLPPPGRPTPLTWRMMEAIGEPMPTANLPIAFAQAELRPSSGWKAQIEAAERLARNGVLEPNQILGLYTERLPAASGGVWDRVEALQRFDTAITAGDPGAVARTLPDAWSAMRAAELEVTFAALYAETLGRLPLGGEAANISLQVGLLSPDYERVASRHTPRDSYETFLVGVARGDLSGARPFDPLSSAVQRAFTGTFTDGDLQRLADNNRLGEAILRAIDAVSRVAAGELRDVTSGLALLRHVGLEDVARRAALQLLLLDRRG